MPRECRKRRYWKRVDALIELAKAEGAGKTRASKVARARRQEFRIYRCPICEGRPWHLSSVPGS